jgi:putative ubiquitin-RnfH superfamily antitoxin RatB of RatAB toxin-antitoxin module
VIPVAVYGDRVSGDRPLEPGDRVELYRPLQIAPREARRQRAGSRATKRGL